MEGWDRQRWVGRPKGTNNMTVCVWARLVGTVWVLSLLCMIQFRETVSRLVGSQLLSIESFLQSGQAVAGRALTIENLLMSRCG